MNDELRKLSKDKREFVFYVCYTNLTQEAISYLTKFKQLKKKDADIIQMKSIHDLKKEDINFVGKFLQYDSITMSFWHESSFNKPHTDHINLPIHVR